MQGVYCLKSHLCSKLGKKKQLRSPSQGELVSITTQRDKLKLFFLTRCDSRTMCVVLKTKFMHSWIKLYFEFISNFWSKSVIFGRCAVWTHYSRCEIIAGPNGNGEKQATIVQNKQGSISAGPVTAEHVELPGRISLSHLAEQTRAARSKITVWDSAEYKYCWWLNEKTKVVV